LTLALDVRQAKGARRPQGSFRATDRRTNTLIEITELGALQTSAGWASITGLGRVGAKASAITVMVEQKDPMDERLGSTLFIRGEDGYTLQTSLPHNAIRLDRPR
jgi:hypothetical protein